MKKSGPHRVCQITTKATRPGCSYVTATDLASLERADDVLALLVFLPSHNRLWGRHQAERGRLCAHGCSLDTKLSLDVYSARLPAMATVKA
jgi:hypothetical protein